jgi:hypothetical protein
MGRSKGHPYRTPTRFETRAVHTTAMSPRSRLGARAAPDLSRLAVIVLEAGDLVR